MFRRIGGGLDFERRPGGRQDRPRVGIGRLAGDIVMIPGYERQASRIYETGLDLGTATIFTDDAAPVGGVLDLYYQPDS